MQENQQNNRIIIENLSKKFQIGFKKNQSTLERFIGLFSGKEPKKTIHALKDVSFTAEKGEISETFIYELLVPIYELLVPIHQRLP